MKKESLFLDLMNSAQDQDVSLLIQKCWQQCPSMFSRSICAAISSSDGAGKIPPLPPTPPYVATTTGSSSIKISDRKIFLINSLNFSQLFNHLMPY